MKHVLRVIDTINEHTGKLVSYLTLFYTGLIVFEVFMRYIINEPTIWSMETTYYTFGAQWLLASGYVLLYDKHIKVEVFYENFTPRIKALVDIITAPMFFLYVGALFWTSANQAWVDTLMGRRSASLWGPPVWPIEIIISISSLLLLLQGLAKFIRDCNSTLKGKEDLS